MAHLAKFTTSLLTNEKPRTSLFGLNPQVNWTTKPKAHPGGGQLTQPPQALDVIGETDEIPFRLALRNATKQKLAEPDFLDDAEDRFNC